MKEKMDNQSYEEAYRELKQIAAEIENESVSVDVLAARVRRASELIAFCQSRLRETELEVNNIIKQMDAKPSGEQKPES